MGLESEDSNQMSLGQYTVPVTVKVTLNWPDPAAAGKGEEARLLHNSRGPALGDPPWI